MTDVIDFETERQRKEVEKKLERMFNEAKAEFEQENKEQRQQIARLSLMLEYIKLMNEGELNEEQYKRWKALKDRGFFG